MERQFDENRSGSTVPGRNNPKVVCIGGGHGLSAMLRGPQARSPAASPPSSRWPTTAAAPACCGQDLGMPPPGDIRSCILALANTEPTMERLLNYRFCEGSLGGPELRQSVPGGPERHFSDTFDEAVHRMGEVLAITGRVLPVTNQDVRLEAGL